MVGSDGRRSFEIRTYGCQMNMHDSERLAGLLEEAGYQRATDGVPDVVVFNTCAVRATADSRLYGTLGHLLPVQKARFGSARGCAATPVSRSSSNGSGSRQFSRPAATLSSRPGAQARSAATTPF